MTDADLIVAFMAKNKVTVCPEGDAFGLNKEKDKNRRADFRVKTDNDLIEERHVTYDHCGREIVTNGLGERIA